jgi:hypothetical protein
MRKITILCFILLAVSCRKVYDAPTPQLAKPDKVGYANVYPTPTTGAVTMNFNLEPNAQYNVTIQGMGGKIYKSYGISSIDGNLIKQENLSDLPSGSYDLILMNINGTQTRTPILKQ